MHAHTHCILRAVYISYVLPYSIHLTAVFSGYQLTFVLTKFGSSAKHLSP